LIQQGWCQGSWLEAASAPRLWLALRNHQEEQNPSRASVSQDVWILQQALLGAEDILIVASHTCDIQRSAGQEPYIEVIRGFWTSDRAIMHHAGKNSSRLFLIQRRSGRDEREEALIADATTHIQIEKAAFLAFAPQSCFKENDRSTPRKFSEWLARRYDRPALPDAIVNAIQKPVVKGIDKLSASHSLHRILDGIDEILFIPVNENVPFQVDMVFIRDERSDAPQVSDEDAARLGNWIAEVLQKGKEAELTHWEILSRKEINVYDYSNAFELPLDYYTAWDDSAES
jgi:hypothetical protein